MIHHGYFARDTAIHHLSETNAVIVQCVTPTTRTLPFRDHFDTPFGELHAVGA